MDNAWLSTEETARFLGVKVETVYAYVSRGLLPRVHDSGGHRSFFPIDDVRRIAAGQGATHAHNPKHTSVSTVVGGTPYYRGICACCLAQSRSFENVAELLWASSSPKATWTFDRSGLEIAMPGQQQLPSGVLPVDRISIALPTLALTDVFRNTTDTEGVAALGRRLLTSLVEILPRQDGLPGQKSDDESGDSFAYKLHQRLSACTPTALNVSILNCALALRADHAMASTTVAVRLAAAAGSYPYGAIGAGLGVGSGGNSGVPLMEISNTFDRIEAGGLFDPKSFGVHARAQITGFGHPLYPQGDPRAELLLGMLRQGFSGSKELAAVEALLDAAAARGLPRPNLRFAVVAAARAMRMIPGASEAIFVLGRMAGWLAHAAEVYESKEVLAHPLTLYTGDGPDICDEHTVASPDPRTATRGSCPADKAQSTCP